MSTMQPRHKSVLLWEVRRLLGLSQRELGELVGWSKRTILRWEGGRSDVHAASLLELVPHVFPKDPALAEEIAAAAGSTLLALGLVQPPAPPQPPPPAPQPPPPLPAHLLADSVVCAAADALRAMPETARGSVYAAFKRARELRMTVEEVEQALAPRQAEKPQRRKLAT